MTTRRFAFTVTVTDNRNHLVTTGNGESTVTNGSKTHDEICQSIIDDLPGHLRRRDYSHRVVLTQL